MVPTEPVGIRRGSPCSARDRAVVRRGFSDEAGRGCPAGRRLGSGQPPAQHKSIAGGCLFPGAAIVPGQKPESRDTGVSLFAENGSHPEVAPVTNAAGVHVGGLGSNGNTGTGSHLAEVDAAESHARQVGGPGSSKNAGTGSHLAGEGAAESLAGQVGVSGSSGNAENGSHLEAADFSNEPGAVLWRRPPPRRTESGLLSYGTASPDSSVQKTALWCTRGSS